jgi:transcriptional regulator with XRE-family HTH domain
MESEENLVKKTCRELGITQKELAEKTGFKEQTLRNWSSKGHMPDYSKNYLLLLLEYNKQQRAIKDFSNFINYINPTQNTY